MKVFIRNLAIKSMVLDILIHNGKLSKEEYREIRRKVEEYIDNSNSSSEALELFSGVLERGEFD